MKRKLGGKKIERKEKVMRKEKIRRPKSIRKKIIRK